MKYYSYLNTAVAILTLYKGGQPFNIFIKEFFRSNKKYGSRDRKQISHLCYCYFRLGKAAPDLPTEQRILLGLFLCTETPSEMLQQLRPDWNEQTQLSLDQKLGLPEIQLSLQSIFPWNELSATADQAALCRSFFVQPDLFLRIRPGQEKKLAEKLEAGGIAYHTISSSCIAFPATSPVDKLIEIDKEAVVQDMSSQSVGAFIPLTNDGRAVTVWDCCAASGGKSIMAYDLNPAIQLTVSDIRDSILNNLRKRFTVAGLRQYQVFKADLSRAGSQIPKPGTGYDLIIADLPCTGSGTWGRTPEQLHYFEEKKITEYAGLQQSILSTVLPALKPGGYFLYITCSVFRQENEDALAFILEKQEYVLLKKELLTGYGKKADTLFVALLQRLSYPVN